MADEVDAQFGLDSVVKEVLANATVMDSTPGPVNVSAEEGWTSMSLLYIDPNGDLFLKEQQNQPVTWDGTDITIGPTNSEHIAISSSAIDFKDGTRMYNPWGYYGGGNRDWQDQYLYNIIIFFSERRYY